MTERRKRRVSLGPPSARQRRRTDVDHRGYVMRSITALLVVVVAVASDVVHQYTPRARVRHDPERVSWDKHLDDLRHREIFRWFYRIDERSFDKAKSDNGVFDFVVAAVDGLFIKGIAPTTSETPNVFSHYSGSKSDNGINVQASCDADYRFCNMSIISPGSTNDRVSWTRLSLVEAVRDLRPDYHTIDDGAYPISDQLLTLYPGKNLPPGEDSLSFHLSQLRVEIEQSFGILVSTWGVLWRPLKVSLAGRPDLITALIHLHTFLQDETVCGIRVEEEDDKSGKGRPGPRWGAHVGTILEERDTDSIERWRNSLACACSVQAGSIQVMAPRSQHRAKQLGC